MSSYQQIIIQSGITATNPAKAGLTQTHEGRRVLLNLVSLCGRVQMNKVLRLFKVIYGYPCAPRK